MVYHAIDLFAGIGGIRMGFEKAFGRKLDTVFVSEWDIPAQQTYRANFHDKFEIAGDITQIKEGEIPPFDICLAGFPCQAFSMAGKHGGFQDNYKGRCRGTLFQDGGLLYYRAVSDDIFCTYLHKHLYFDRPDRGGLKDLAVAEGKAYLEGRTLSDEEKKAILDRHSVKGKWGYIYKEDDKFYMAINFQTRFR